jgi:hypothetical protein
MRRMLIASGPSASATAMAALMISARDSPRSRRGVWPMQHPELAVVCWSVAMLMVFAPLAVHLYRRKALG